MINSTKNSSLIYLAIILIVGTYIARIAITDLSFYINKLTFNHFASKLEQELISINNTKYKGQLVKIKEGEYELRIVSRIEDDKQVLEHKRNTIAKYVNLRDSNPDYFKERKVPEEILNDILKYKMALALDIWIKSSPNLRGACFLINILIFISIMFW